MKIDPSREHLATPGGWDTLRIVRYHNWFEAIDQCFQGLCRGVVDFFQGFWAVGLTVYDGGWFRTWRNKDAARIPWGVDHVDLISPALHSRPSTLNQKTYRIDMCGKHKNTMNMIWQR